MKGVGPVERNSHHTASRIDYQVNSEKKETRTSACRQSYLVRRMYLLNNCLNTHSGIHYALVGNLVSQLKFSLLDQYVFPSISTCSSKVCAHEWIGL